MKTAIVNAAGTVHQLVTRQGLLDPKCDGARGARYREIRPVHALVFHLPGCEDCFPMAWGFQRWLDGDVKC